MSAPAPPSSRSSSAHDNPVPERLASFETTRATDAGTSVFVQTPAALAVGDAGIFLQMQDGGTLELGAPPSKKLTPPELWNLVRARKPARALAFAGEDGGTRWFDATGAYGLEGGPGYDGAPSRSEIVEYAPKRRVLAAHASSPAAMTADAERFFWTASGRLLGVPRGGGTPRELWKGKGLAHVAADDENLYVCCTDPDGENDRSCELGWSKGTCSKRIVRIPKRGGDAVSFVERQATCEGVALDAKSVIWASGGMIFRKDKSGGPVRLVERNAGEPYNRIVALVVHDDAIHWISRNQLFRTRLRQ